MAQPPKQEGRVRAKYAAVGMHFIDYDQAHRAQKVCYHRLFQVRKHPGVNDIRGKNDHPGPFQNVLAEARRHIPIDPPHHILSHCQGRREPGCHKSALPALALFVAQGLHRVNCHDACFWIARQQIDRRRLEHQAFSGSRPGRQAHILTCQSEVEGCLLVPVDAIWIKLFQECQTARRKGKIIHRQAFRCAWFSFQNINDVPMIAFKEIPETHSHLISLGPIIVPDKGNWL